MDPFTIATTVTKITTTCLTTGKAIYDLSCKYQDAPRNMVAISSEVAVISASLSQIQALILSKPDPEHLLRTRPELAATLDTSLTGCMVLFSCLDEEIREVSRHSRGLDKLSWRGKIKTVWKQETFQELLDGLRGQQMAVNTLIQLLQMDSLTEITQLLKQNGPQLKATIVRTNTLRRSHPSVRVAESIYTTDDRASVYSAADSFMASSELEFDFDDIIVNSTAYRRALAAARHEAPSPRIEDNVGDLIDFSDGDTTTQEPVNYLGVEGLTLSEDLLGLQFPTAVNEPSSQLQVTSVETSVGLVPNMVRREPTAGPAAKSPVSNNITLHKEISTLRSHEDTSIRDVNSNQAGIPPRDARLSPFQRSTKQNQRFCSKCDGILTGQFVRAIGGTYHLECFTCNDCGKIVASKFFPFPDEPPHEYPLCMQDYFKRLDMICFSCQEPLKGSYITALNRKYHLDHFCCSYPSCRSPPFGEQDSYYEEEGEVYCLKHYAGSFAKICPGCSVPILKQFAEISRPGKNDYWHPECYMIHKYWNVKLFPLATITKMNDVWVHKAGGGPLEAPALPRHLEGVEDTIQRTWHGLSTFEEKSATVLSDLLLEISNRSPLALLKLPLLISAFEMLFQALNTLDHTRRCAGTTGVGYARESKLLCKKVVSIMQLIAEAKNSTTPAGGPTQELLSLVTGIAHYLKLLIRIALSGSLKSKDWFERLLVDMSMQNFSRGLEQLPRVKSMTGKAVDTCRTCKKPVEDACFRRDGEPIHLWHEDCVLCWKCRSTRAFGEASVSAVVPTPFLSCQYCEAQEVEIRRVTRLDQYVYLLWVAFARLMDATGTDFASLNDVPRQMEDILASKSRTLDDGEPNKSGLLEPFLQNK